VRGLIWEEANDPTTAVLLRDIVALHSDMTSLATESASGSVRSAAARSTAVALIAELHAARAVKTALDATRICSTTLHAHTRHRFGYQGGKLMTPEPRCSEGFLVFRTGVRTSYCHSAWGPERRLARQLVELSQKAGVKL
jgi:hypothetical protein